MGETEDEFAEALVRHHRQASAALRDPNTVDIYPQTHFNYRGSHGVADLYARTGHWEGSAYKFRSEQAVQQGSSASAILRQFNKMREFLFSGSNHEPPEETLTFELCFEPAENTFRHVAENADLYREAVRQQVCNVRRPEVHASVTMRPPDPARVTPRIVFFEGEFDVFDVGLESHIRDAQPRVLEQYRAVIEEIVETQLQRANQPGQSTTESPVTEDLPEDHRQRRTDR